MAEYVGYSIQFVCVKSLSRIRLFATPWTIARQAPLSMGFSRQEYWSGLPFPSPGDLPDPGIEPESPALLVDALSSEPPGKPILLHGKCFFTYLAVYRYEIVNFQVCMFPRALIYLKK